MKKVSILDTSICTENIGDKIIMDSASKEISNIFKNSFYVNIPTHEKISRSSYYHIKNSDYTIACGTNMLSSNMLKYNQWKVNLVDSIFVKDVILLGVGWWQYQKKPDRYTSLLLNRLLSKEGLHSVRDNYTKEMLNSIGINNVINTACPTMWSLSPNHCKEIPISKAKNVVITLTDYNKDELLDGKLLDIVDKNYESVYFWIQSFDDLPYLEKLRKGKQINIIPPTLLALDSLLNSNISLDYIGTRLHAGIRALQSKRRSIIIGIDNRAQEKSKDFGLKVLKREEIEKLDYLINSNFKTDIKIPIDNISKWRDQFN